MFERTIALIGQDNFQKLQNSKVLLIGVGGVGSYALEALVRNGIGHITIIDADKIELSNLNRQLMTCQDNIGTSKVEAATLRARAINPDIDIAGYEVFLDKSNIEEYIDSNYDYIIDACDTIEVKFMLMELSLKYSYKLISAMGTAKKIDPTKLEITTLDKTRNDPLARILRKKVKDAHINKKLMVVSSTENPVKMVPLGSNNLVPSVAGLLCVSFIINDILKH